MKTCITCGGPVPTPSDDPEQFSFGAGEIWQIKLIRDGDVVPDWATHGWWATSGAEALHYHEIKANPHEAWPLDRETVDVLRPGKPASIRWPQTWLVFVLGRVL